MNGQLKAAIIVEAIVLAVALAFSVVYFTMGLYQSSNVLDVMLVVLWILVAVVLLVVFWSRSHVREEMVRRFYLSHDWIYNHEIGYAPLDQIMPERDAYEFVTFAADALARMSYGFEVASAPDDFQPEYLISSKSFSYHLIGNEDDPDDNSVVIDKWKGTLHSVQVNEQGGHTYTKVGDYSNAKELARLIDTNNAITNDAVTDDWFEDLGL